MKKCIMLYELVSSIGTAMYSTLELPPRNQDTSLI